MRGWKEERKREGTANGNHISFSSFISPYSTRLDSIILQHNRAQFQCNETRPRFSFIAELAWRALPQSPRQR